MKFLELIYLTIFIHASQSVVVFLEGGSRSNLNKEVVLGSSPVLDCSITSSVTTGNPKLDWRVRSSGTGGENVIYVNGLLSDETKYDIIRPSSLIINSITADDSGIYTCRGIQLSDTPSVAFLYYNLTVLVPPSEKISCGFPKNQEIYLQTATEFRCEEETKTATPSPTFAWFKNGVEMPLLSSDDLKTYPNSNFSYSPVTGILSFSTVVSEDAGEYYCMARNKAGNESCTPTNIRTVNMNYFLKHVLIKFHLEQVGSNQMKVVLNLTTAYRDSRTTVIYIQLRLRNTGFLGNWQRVGEPVIVTYPNETYTFSNLDLGKRYSVLVWRNYGMNRFYKEFVLRPVKREKRHIFIRRY